MGNKRGHKGGHRRFTNPQEIQLRKEKEDREKEWRRKRGEVIEDSDEEDESQESGDESQEDKPERKDKKPTKRQEESESEEESEEDEESDGEDDEPLIEICNPNRMPAAKPKKDVNALANAKVTLTRKEREQLEEQKASTQVNKSQMERDMARLAIIRKQREEAKKKKETESQKPTVSSSKTVSKK